ncbi:DUF1842 domain-containing protein [Shewanella woodyi]|uniref:DUF1842 domain-containing protein n=1 Tax=Shewanella woodyi TaxID=60961 RepID=UPI0007F86479|nr:DUF1842 domain-containing protein [Shewanella woodyi]
MSKENQVGLFRVSYVISPSVAGHPLLGATQLRLELVVNTVDKTVNGVGHVFQSTNPPVNVISQFSGEWSYMCTMDSCNILVVADGFDFSSILIGGHPVEHKNATLRMSLGEDWQSGVANFSYLYEGEWYEIEAAQVVVSNDETQQNLDALTTFTTANKPKVSMQ